jgi:hypothetical protein
MTKYNIWRSAEKSTAGNQSHQSTHIVLLLEHLSVVRSGRICKAFKESLWMPTHTYASIQSSMRQSIKESTKVHTGPWMPTNMHIWMASHNQAEHDEVETQPGTFVARRQDYMDHTEKEEHWGTKAIREFLVTLPGKFCRESGENNLYRTLFRIFVAYSIRFYGLTSFDKNKALNDSLVPYKTCTNLYGTIEGWDL